MSETRRKNFTGTYKGKVALEAIRSIKTVAEIGHEFGIYFIHRNKARILTSPHHHRRHALKKPCTPPRPTEVSRLLLLCDLSGWNKDSRLKQLVLQLLFVHANAYPEKVSK